MEDINEYVGKRIRELRRSRKMSIQQLADIIGKSKACVSKYEIGQITIDIPTLYDISRALHVPVNRFLDYPLEPQSEPARELKGSSQFWRAQRLYFYYCDGRYSLIRTGVINIHNEENKTVAPADFTINMELDNGVLSEFYYSGTVTYGDMVIRFSLQNQYNYLEENLLYIFNPLDYRNGTNGLLCGMSSINMAPCAFKCIVSLTELPQDEALKKRLIFTKEELKQIRSLNLLTVSNH